MLSKNFIHVSLRPFLTLYCTRKNVATYLQLEAWFSYVGNIPGDRGFNFLPTVPDFADISDIVSERPCLSVIGGLEPSNLEDWYGAKSIADVPDGTNLSFHLSGIIADHRRNLGRVEKIESLPILQISP